MNSQLVPTTSTPADQIIEMLREHAIRYSVNVHVTKRDGTVISGELLAIGPTTIEVYGYEDEHTEAIQRADIATINHSQLRNLQPDPLHAK